MYQWKKAYSEMGHEYAAAELYSFTEVFSSAFSLISIFIFCVVKKQLATVSAVTFKASCPRFIPGHRWGWVFSLLNRAGLRNFGVPRCCTCNLLYTMLLH